MGEKFAANPVMDVVQAGAGAAWNMIVDWCKKPQKQARIIAKSYWQFADSIGFSGKSIMSKIPDSIGFSGKSIMSKIRHS